MTTLTVNQAAALLSSYDEQYSQASRNVASLQSTLLSQTAQLRSLITSNASQSDIQAQTSLLNNTTDELTQAKNVVTSIAASKVKAVDTLRTNSGVTGPFSNPFVGSPGPTGPRGPTGPSAPAVALDAVAVSGSSNPISSSGAYNAIQSFLASQSSSSGSSVTVGTSSSLSSAVRLQCHFDGTDGSSTFTDSSSYNTTFTNVGGATLSTSTKTFGTSCLNLTNGSYLQWNQTLSIGTQPCTFECWFNKPSSSFGGTNYNIMSLGSTSSITSYVSVSGTPGNTSIWNNFLQGGNFAVQVSITPDVWHHLAFCRDSSANYAFLDGALFGYNAVGPANITSTTLCIGRGNGTTNSNIYGYIDDLRVTIGTCRYTSSFIPPNMAFPDKTPSFPATSNSQGQLWTDGTSLYICTVSGNPGTWKRVGLNS